MRWTALMPALLLAAPAPAQDVPAPPSPAPVRPDPSRMSPEALKNVSGLKVPRFVSLRASRANLRAGPGTSYPASVTFIRAGIPLEVINEWNVWRQVRDAEGETGWLDRAMLGPERSFQVTGEVRTLRARPDVASPAVWRAEPGVVGRIVTCAEAWCRIEVDGRAGWILREHGFGTYPGEPVGN